MNRKTLFRNTGRECDRHLKTLWDLADQVNSICAFWPVSLLMSRQ
jgi:hypothetical protein